MILYRVCNDEEYKNIISNNYNIIGNVCKKTSINSHNYKDGHKYLHFFDNLSNIFYLDIKEKKYLCIYEIPDDIAIKYKGYGLYCDYIRFKGLEKIDEFAIDMEELSIEYINKIYYFKNNVDILDYIEGYFDDNSIEGFVFNNCSIVYDNCGVKYEKKLY